ncbi:DNA topoisomerase IB [Agromyces sp. CFH 90414]|uniref:DNA topoisomerase n=1 Tax=Agromyces agglutinans TaxID=2662258 RepID=A0A6I2FB70_9MICO|nr:DNA topoisomerase IB [Agromyces agglutinans]MRG59686.1 DNA topoisomerase IB [Agromyces agglutinans]
MPRLKRVEPYASPGWRRVRRGSGFAYVHEDGSAAGRAERTRIAELAVPPAWTEVWIADAANAHILAVGVDAAGRRQYLYHPAWRERQDAEKFARMTELVRALPAARRLVARDLALDELPRERVLAAAFRTLDAGGLRVGSEESLATARSRGLTTLLVRNAAADASAGAVRFRFRAKGGISQDLLVPDAELAVFVEQNAGRAASARLYAWRDGRRYRALTASDVNDDIRTRTGGEFTAKDFRTLRGTLAAATQLAEIGTEATAKARARAVRDAVEEAARVLGNTPTIARASYIDPRVITAYEAGQVISRRGAPERALLDLVEPKADVEPDA